MAIGFSNKKSEENKVRGRLPVKKSINIAAVGQKKTRLAVALPLFLFALAVIAVFTKFLVMDRLEAVDREEQRVRELRTQLSAANTELEGFGELKEEYAHYTFADMTEEELQRVERSDVVELLERIVISRASLSSWSVRQNQLTLAVTLDTLQDTSELVQLLNEDARVDYATVKSAVTNEIKPRTPTTAPAEPAFSEDSEGEGAKDGAEEAQEPSPAGEAEAGEDEKAEPGYNVSAQIIVYLTAAEKEGSA